MQFPDQAGRHLTYCLNVHPAESWAECFDAIRTHTLAVRNRVCPDNSFGLGLRLSAQAADELSDPETLDTFRTFLNEQNLYVFTVNAFPFGRFHGGHVKERVYQPDWTTDARRDYTMRVADVLAALLPEGVQGSISTVPGAYKLLIRAERDQQVMAEHLMDTVAHLAAIHRNSGREIHLGLEPEPACFIETTEECVSFFNEMLLAHGRTHLCGLIGVDPNEAEQLIRRHLGVCIDTCHAALQFEECATVIERYRAEGIRISKVQLSAALEALNTESARMALRSFDEPVYLHQVHAQCADGRLLLWNDLPDALAALPRQPMAETVRVHYHVPLFWEGAAPLKSTARLLDPPLWKQLAKGVCSHLEIETYTFDVLPEALKAGTIDDSIVREYEWVMARLG